MLVNEERAFFYGFPQLFTSPAIPVYGDPQLNVHGGPTLVLWSLDLE